MYKIFNTLFSNPDEKNFNTMPKGTEYYDSNSGNKMYTDGLNKHIYLTSDEIPDSFFDYKNDTIYFSDNKAGIKFEEDTIGFINHDTLNIYVAPNANGSSLSNHKISFTENEMRMMTGVSYNHSIYKYDDKDNTYYYMDGLAASNDEAAAITNNIIYDKNNNNVNIGNDAGALFLNPKKISFCANSNDPNAARIDFIDKGSQTFTTDLTNYFFYKDIPNNNLTIEDGNILSFNKDYSDETVEDDSFYILLGNGTLQLEDGARKGPNVDLDTILTIE